MPEEIDTHDPELQSADLYALASMSLGVISLCAGIIPMCGGIASLAGIFFGVISSRVEKNKMATVGIWTSSLGLLITVTYFIFLSVFRN